MGGARHDRRSSYALVDAESRRSTNGSTRGTFALRICVVVMAIQILFVLISLPCSRKWPQYYGGLCRCKDSKATVVSAGNTEAEDGETSTTSGQDVVEARDNGTIRRTTFLFMLQAKVRPHEKWLTRSRWPRTAVICLVWQKEEEVARVGAIPPTTPPGALRYRLIHHSNTTWTSGRNRLLQEANSLEHAQLWKFEFYVFFDEDAFLSYRNAFYPQKVVVNRDNDDEALKRFAMLLLRDRPMRAGLGFNPSEDLGGPFTDANFGCIRKCHMDPIVAAYHRDAVDILLPYTERFDAQSWYASGLIADLFAAAVVPSQCYVYEEVLVELAGQEHSSYPKSMDAELLVEHVKFCLSNATYRDYHPAMPTWEVRKKVAGGMGYHSGLHIGDHYRQVGDYPCRRNPPDVDFVAQLGTETAALWRAHCL